MGISQTLLPEFDQEMATTRKLLERVPEDRLSWQPHSKSMSLGRLATHLAELPGLGHRVMTQESHNVSPPGGEGYKPRTLSTRQEILDLFDKNIATTRQAIESVVSAKPSRAAVPTNNPNKMRTKFHTIR